MPRSVRRKDILLHHFFLILPYLSPDQNAHKLGGYAAKLLQNAPSPPSASFLPHPKRKAAAGQAGVTMLSERTLEGKKGHGFIKSRVLRTQLVFDKPLRS